jgi:hypothetical protein
MKALLALAISFCVSSAFAVGQDRGNGGDSNALDFVNSGTRIFNFLKRHPASAAALGIDPEKLLPALRRVRVETTENLYLNGVEVDAINYPDESLIKVSSTRWIKISDLADATIQKQNIALHEYLWVLGFDDTNYKLSSAIITEARAELLALRPNPASDTLLGALCKAIVELDYTTAKSLLQLRFDVNRRCPAEFTTRMSTQYPLPFLVDRHNWRPTSKEDLELMESLLMAGANPNGFVDSYFLQTSFLTVLIGRSSNNGEAAAKLLIDYGADPNARGIVATSRYDDIADKNRSSLHEALLSSIPGDLKPDFLEWLIDVGADMNRLIKSNPGWILYGDNTPGCEILKSTRQDLKAVLAKKGNVDSSLCK